MFIEARMLHWPDSMFCYLTEDNILFSNDAFGQHYATEFLFNDEVDQAELYQEAIKYYANILTPFSTFKEENQGVRGLKSPCIHDRTSHGIIGDNSSDCGSIYEWVDNYQENQIILIDTMWNGTRWMVEAIVRNQDANPVRRLNLQCRSFR